MLEQLAFYLSKRHKKGTVRSYLWASEHFITHVGEDALATLKYHDVMAYVAKLRAEEQKANHISMQLAAVKTLFNFLIAQGMRIDNPAYGVVLKDSHEKPVQFQDLFSHEELKSLLYRKERYSLLRYRNQTILGLLIYQALTLRELIALRLTDIYLESGEVFVAAKTKTLSRILRLESSQVQAMHHYISYERPELLKKGTGTDLLLVGKLGTVLEKDTVHYLVSTRQSRFPGRPLNCVTIRQSVIVNKFHEGLGLREVQLFAGIKYASTVERYRPVDRAELLNTLLRFHPMG